MGPDLDHFSKIRRRPNFHHGPSWPGGRGAGGGGGTFSWSGVRSKFNEPPQQFLPSVDCSPAPNN